MDEPMPSEEKVLGSPCTFSLAILPICSICLFSSEWDELTDQEFLYRVLQKASIPHREIGVAHYRIHQKNSTVRWAGDRIGVNPRVKALGALLAMKYGLSPSWQAS